MISRGSGGRGKLAQHVVTAGFLPNGTGSNIGFVPRGGPGPKHEGS